MGGCLLLLLLIIGYNRGLRTAVEAFAYMNQVLNENWQHKQTRIGFSHETFKMVLHWQFDFQNEKGERETFVTTIWGTDYVGVL